MKELIVRITKEDCDWEYFRGSGAGGQKRNKTSSAVRCTHRASGAVGRSEDGRSQVHNKQLAFKRMSETKIFKDWLRIEVAKRLGAEEDAKLYAEREIKNVRVEIREDGKWKEINKDKELDNGNE